MNKKKYETMMGISSALILFELVFSATVDDPILLTINAVVIVMGVVSLILSTMLWYRAREGRISQTN